MRTSANTWLSLSKALIQSWFVCFCVCGRLNAKQPRSLQHWPCWKWFSSSRCTYKAFYFWLTASKPNWYKKFSVHYHLIETAACIYLFSMCRTNIPTEVHDLHSPTLAHMSLTVFIYLFILMEEKGLIFGMNCHYQTSYINTKQHRNMITVYYSAASLRCWSFPRNESHQVIPQNHHQWQFTLRHAAWKWISPVIIHTEWVTVLVSSCPC